MILGNSFIGQPTLCIIALCLSIDAAIAGLPRTGNSSDQYHPRWCSTCSQISQTNIGHSSGSYACSTLTLSFENKLCLYYWSHFKLAPFQARTVRHDHRQPGECASEPVWEVVRGVVRRKGTFRALHMETWVPSGRG